MINQCKFLNIVLHICGSSNTQCQYMTDPHLCPNYNEDSDRSYVERYSGINIGGHIVGKKSLAEITSAESKRINMEVESLTEFTNRIEAELDGMGIKVTKEIPPVGTSEYMKYWRGLTNDEQEAELARRKAIENQPKEEAPDWF